MTYKLSAKRNIEEAKIKHNQNPLPLWSPAGEVSSVLKGDPGIH